jgi:glycosyltransferase involved in cell wall biosynthesis
MKVLVLSDYYPPDTKGGADIAAERLSAELARRGHTVRALATTSDPSLVGTTSLREVEVRRAVSAYPIRLRNYVATHNPRVVGWVSRQSTEFQPDIVHAHNVHTHMSFQALIAAGRTGAPVILTAHDHQLFCGAKFNCSAPDQVVGVAQSKCAGCQRLRYFPLRNPLIRRALRLSRARVLAVSGALRDDLVANGADGSAIDVVHNGIDPASMRVSAEYVQAFAARHALEGSKVILFGGRVSPAKGIDQAVAAAGSLPRSLNIVLLVLGSNDEYRDYLQRMSQRLAMEDRIRFLPWLSGDDLRAAYAASDVCVTPSMYREPFNLINIEAMAARKPVVTTCFGGPPEVVADGVTGYVVDPRDTGQFSARLLKLLSDGEAARTMGEAGYARLLERFTIAHQADRVLDMYHSLLGRAS